MQLPLPIFRPLLRLSVLCRRVTPASSVSALAHIFILFTVVIAALWLLVCDHLFLSPNGPAPVCDSLGRGCPVM